MGGFEFTKSLYKIELPLTRAAMKARDGGVYETHRDLYRLWPPSEQRDFLFARFRKDSSVLAYVLAQKPPSGEVRFDRAPFPTSCKEGDTFKFFLRVSPIVSASSDKGDKTDRRDLSWEGGGRVFEWLIKRGRAGGGKFSHLQVTGFNRVPITGKNERPVWRPFLDLVGRVTVVEPEPFVRLIESGIGRNKSFGAGLCILKIDGWIS